MVVTHAGANKQMEEEIAAIRSKLEDLDQNFSASIINIHPWTTAASLSLLQTLGSHCLATTAGRSWIFLTSMVIIRLDGFIG